MKKVYFTVLGKRYKIHVNGDPKAEIMKRIEESLKIDKVEDSGTDPTVEYLKNIFNMK